MTLFIACLLIYHLNLDAWWYGIAVIFYAIPLLATVHETVARLKSMSWLP
jgi:hypothetical protein